MKPGHLKVLPATLFASAALFALAGCGGSDNNNSSNLPDIPGTGRAYRITVTNLTTGQIFSPSLFFTHGSGYHLWQVGQPAVFGVMRTAEEGNIGPLSSATVVPGLGTAFGSAVDQISLLPGETRSVTIRADAAHPYLTAIWMLVRTNDGFSGIDALNLTTIPNGRVTFDTPSYDAGTEKNNERAPFLIAREGTERDPENSVITTPHPGIRGDADAPKTWDFKDPVARVTVEAQ